MLRSIVKRRLRMPLCHRRTNAALCTINVSASTDHTLPAQSSRQAASEQGRRFVSEDSASPSISAAEMSKFSALAETWWDSRGPFKALHLMNPARISFIRSVLCKHFRKDTCCARPLKGLHILDVGCGGGLLCEPLARLGARVVGIDAVEKNIKVAAAHAVKDPLTASIKYLCTTSDKLVGEGYEQFDAVISLEVIEHVTEPKMFVESLAGLTKADGSIIISTINRSISGYFLAIVAAEHLLQWEAELGL
ncbi:hypothetical protein KP509_03G017100 [Ceratopteris richardii]|nr:hypothetical protein KP509_03G017100 [Ceratopteris richardii]KAH7440944.1 hypothetical protein KP509_03G017100 [Ceratopteris richardii]